MVFTVVFFMNYIKNILITNNQKYSSVRVLDVRNPEPHQTSGVRKIVNLRGRRGKKVIYSCIGRQIWDFGRAERVKHIFFRFAINILVFSIQISVI